MKMQPHDLAPLTTLFTFSLSLPLHGSTSVKAQFWDMKSSGDSSSFLGMVVWEYKEPYDI
jgi:hypothetical protein